MLLVLALIAATKPEVIVQTGPGNKVFQIALSPDDRYLAVANQEQSHVSIWDVERGLLLRHITGFQMTPERMVFAPASNTLYVINSSALFRANIETGVIDKPLAEVQGTDLTITKDGKRAYASTWSGIVGIDLDAFKVKDKLTTVAASRVAVSADGRKLAYAEGYDEGSIHLFDLKTKAHVQASGRMGRLVFNATGSTLLVGSYGQERGLDTKTLQPRWIHTTSASGWSAEPKGSGFLTSKDSTVITIDAETGVETNRFKGVYAAQALVASQRSRLLVGALFDNEIHFADADRGKIKELKGRHFEALHVVSSPDGKWIASQHGDQSVRIWDASTGRQLHQLRNAGYKLAFSADGKQLLSGGREWALWETTGFTRVAQPPIASVPPDVSGLSFADGRVVYTLAPLDVVAVSLQTGVEQWRSKRQEATYRTSLLSPDGRMVAASTHAQDLHLIDAQSGGVMKTIKGHAIQGKGLAFSPDGRWLAAPGEKGLLLVDMATQTARECVGGVGVARAMAFSADSRTIAMADWGGTERVLIWDVTACALRQRIVGHTGVISGVAFINDGAHVVSAGRNSGELRLDRVTDGQHVLRAIALNHGFVSVLPEGHYAASRTASDAVRFSIGMRSYPFDLFELRLHRPDLVIKALGVREQRVSDAYRAAYLKRLERMGFKESDLSEDFHVPEVQVSDAGAAQLKIDAKDSQRPVQRLLVAINGVPLESARGADWMVPVGKPGTRTITLPLGAGDNDVSVSVLNSAGIESERIHISRPNSQPARVTTHIVAVGVSKYREVGFDLDYAAKDAQDLATTLAARGAATKIHLLKDAEVTREALAGLRAVLMQTAVDDQVILFFAGHGLLDDALDFYYATHDVTFAQPSLRGIPYAAIEGLLEGIPARKKLLLLDTCHSGEVDKDELSAGGTILGAQGVKRRGLKSVAKKSAPLGLKLTSELERDLFADLRMGSGATVLSSAAGAQFALESSEWQNGVFTYSLLRGLRERAADANNDKRVTISELRDYLLQSVPALTQGQQTPTARAVNQAADFAL